MNLINVLKSQEDKSVNFLFDNKVEARFVQREPDYFIAYLSSHTGCNKACRFCHLTQTKQTDFTHVSELDYIKQAKTVLDYYKNNIDIKAQKVNFNFMARGEVLANQKFIKNHNLIMNSLAELANNYGLESQINLSTIMPEEVKQIRFSSFPNVKEINHSFYYSLYSLDEDFRKKWIPKSIEPELALTYLRTWQELTDGLVVFHWAFIEGENDKVETIHKLMNMIDRFNLRCKFNLVRYNPFSESQGRESNDIVLKENFKLISEFMGNKDSRIVPRVGFDVKASCGMFVA